jgi:hypothetical protein
MKFIKWLLLSSLLVLIIGSLTSCGNKENSQTAAEKMKADESVLPESSDPQQLPVRFQKPSYFTQDLKEDASIDEKEESAIKVGANITSTKGPQPLWDILKRLATLKGMNVSWASDVDQSVLVDVNISSDDNFFDAVDNLLRQVDYFHEVKDNTIVVKYKETKQFHITIPYMKGNYNTSVGGNFLSNREAASGTEGTVKIASVENTFDIWQNISANLDTLLSAWQTTTVSSTTTTTAAPAAATPAAATPAAATPAALPTRQFSNSSAYYTIDKSVGLITVTAPKSILEKVDFYIKSLTKELYRQVIIEAKIIEVYLQDNSRIGLDWGKVLENFNVLGSVQFGSNGQVWPWIPADPGLSPRSHSAAPISVSCSTQ